MAVKDGYSEFHRGAQGSDSQSVYSDYTGPTGKLTPKSYGETPFKEPPSKPLGGKS